MSLLGVKSEKCLCIDNSALRQARPALYITLCTGRAHYESVVYVCVLRKPINSFIGDERRESRGGSSVFHSYNTVLGCLYSHRRTFLGSHSRGRIRLPIPPGHNTSIPISEPYWHQNNPRNLQSSNLLIVLTLTSYCVEGGTSSKEAVNLNLLNTHILFGRPTTVLRDTFLAHHVDCANTAGGKNRAQHLCITKPQQRAMSELFFSLRESVTRASDIHIYPSRLYPTELRRKQQSIQISTNSTAKIHKIGVRLATFGR